MENIPANILSLLMQGFVETQDCVGLFSPNDDLIYCNDSLATMFGTTKLVATNQPFDKIIEHCFLHNEGVIIEATELEHWLTKAKHRRRSVPFRRFDVDLHDGRWMQITEQTMADGHILICATDITLKMTAQEQLTYLSDNLLDVATLDTTTLAYNHNHFMTLANITWQRCQRTNNSANILIIKIDNLEELSERHGVGYTDEKLRRLAALLKDQLRAYDILGRLSDDRFGVMLADLPPIIAHSIAKRLLTACNSLNGDNQQQLKFKVSAGLSTHQTLAMELNQAITLANDNLGNV